MFLRTFFLCKTTLLVVEHSWKHSLELQLFHSKHQGQLFPPFMKHPMCMCFLCKDAKNETFVSCRTFLRTFSELAFDLQASRTKPVVSSFHKTSHVRVFLLLDVQEQKKWILFMQNVLGLSACRGKGPYVIANKNSCNPLLRNNPCACVFLFGKQECQSCKICHMENVLKNILVFPFLLETNTRD